MKIVGIIAEYNPFHNGHQYHIETARRLTQADAVIVVMSGNFVQRGAPAIMPKHMRAEAALRGSADIIIELPVCYATGTAEQFAYGAISLLDKLGCVDTVCFGSECGDIAVLQETARILACESPEYQSLLQEILRDGLSYPLARQKAIASLYPDKNYSHILEEPNNILGIEYIKALYQLKSNMKPFTIKREFSGYHDKALTEGYSSASAIRMEIENGHLKNLSNQIPAGDADRYMQEFGQRFPIYTNDFSLLLKQRLLSETKFSLVEYADVSEELANRIINRRNSFLNFEQFCDLLKTKEITYTRISRALLHILLNIKKTDYTDIAYARLLGLRENSAATLGTIKRHSSIPLISNLSSIKEASFDEQKMLQKDIFASDLYESVVTDKYKLPFINEYQHQFLKL